MDFKDIRLNLKTMYPEGYVTRGQYRSNSYSTPYYVVATEKEGLFFYINRRKTLDLALHVPWVDVPNTLYLRKDKNDKTYRTKVEVLLTIFVGDMEGKKVAELIEGRRLLLPWTKFPWYRKIPGYRSQVAWKMVMASMFYFFFFGMFFALVSNGEDDTAKVVKQPLVRTEAEEEPKKQTDSDIAKKKANEQKASAKAKVIEEKKAAQEKKQADLEKKKQLIKEKEKAEAQRKAKEEAARKAEKEAAAVPVGFDNCDDLRTEYPNGVPSSHPAYEAKMDRDKDNFACEQN
ncbi:excalibur calcium-binding domain-containing protein [Exiguobacterium artemiae]|uniref:excalibur calcium-binding domain-containing protein n=1 Tax=Exiguobacterium artemiae TaxID=340145 RepID=UPI003CFEAB13